MTTRVYLFDGGLANLVRVFPNALQEVPQLRHGRVPNLRPQFGDVFSHDGAKPVLACLWETRVLQLFECPQGWVVPNTCKSTGQVHLGSENVGRVEDVLIRALDGPRFGLRLGTFAKLKNTRKTNSVLTVRLTTEGKRKHTKINPNS